MVVGRREGGGNLSGVVHSEAGGRRRYCNLRGEKRSPPPARCVSGCSKPRSVISDGHKNSTTRDKGSRVAARYEFRQDGKCGCAGRFKADSHARELTRRRSAHLSRFTVSIENAGKQTATYSAPSGSGVE